MSNEEIKKESIRKEDRRNLPLFIVVLVAAGLIGGIMGGSLMAGQNIFALLLEMLSKMGIYFSICFGFLFILAGITMSIIIASLYGSAKKLWDDKENVDDNWEIIEGKLSKALVINSLNFIVTYILYACLVYNLGNNLKVLFDIFHSGKASPMLLFIPIFMLCTIGMFVFIFLNMALQKKIIDLEKIMNPEKKGSIYDFKFKKKWYESCDEAERKQIGIASYKAFEIVNKTCIGMFVAITLIGMVVKITIVPILVVGILWFVQTISFGIESMRISGPGYPGIK